MLGLKEHHKFIVYQRLVHIVFNDLLFLESRFHISVVESNVFQSVALDRLNDSLGLICNSEQPFCRLTADVFMVVTPFDDTNELVSFVHMLESKLSDYNGIEYRLIFGICTTENIEGMNTRQMGDHATLARQSIKGNALENIAFYNGDMKTTLQKKTDQASG